MLKQLKEYRKFVEISGFRSIKVGDARTFAGAICEGLPNNVEFQFFDANLVASWQHLYFAALNALAAFKAKRAISKSLAVETALYASSQRQIKKAIALIGLKSDSSNVAVLILGNSADSVKAGLTTVAKRLGAEPDETVLELSEAKAKQIRRAFDVSETELETVSSGRDTSHDLVNLVVERVALLSTRL